MSKKGSDSYEQKGQLICGLFTYCMSKKAAIRMSKKGSDSLYEQEGQ
jgi:hypothetical protein